MAIGHIGAPSITWDTSRQTGRVESMRLSRRLEMEIGSVSVCTVLGRVGLARIGCLEGKDSCLITVSVVYLAGLMLDEGRVPAEES